NFPGGLTPYGSLPDRPDVLFAGQLTGVEGYTESTSVGILAAVNLDRIVRGLEPVLPPPPTMMGGLMRYLRSADPKHFQPMNSNYGLVGPLQGKIRDKQAKREAMAARAQGDFASWMSANELAPPLGSGVA